MSAAGRSRIFARLEPELAAAARETGVRLEGSFGAILETEWRPIAGLAETEPEEIADGDLHRVYDERARHLPWDLSPGYLASFARKPRLGLLRAAIRPLRDLLRFFALILRTGYLIRPLKVFLPIGFAFLAVGAIRLAYDVFVLHDISDSSTMLLTSGLEVALMGLLAELIVRRQ